MPAHGSGSGSPFSSRTRASWLSTPGSRYKISGGSTSTTTLACFDENCACALAGAGMNQAHPLGLQAAHPQRAKQLRAAARIEDEACLARALEVARGRRHELFQL